MKSKLLKAAMQTLQEASQRDMWIADKLEQLRIAAERTRKPFDENRAKMILIRRYQEEMRMAPRAVALDVKASQERQKMKQAAEQRGGKPQVEY